MIPHMPYLAEQASKVGFVLELGTGHGNGSTRALSIGLDASTHSDKLMVSVELQADKPEEKPKYPWWHIVHADTKQYLALKSVQEICGERKADLILIDTHHTYPQLKRELEVWRNLAHKETIWLFHDTWMEGSEKPFEMTNALYEFVAANPPLFYRDITKEAFGMGRMESFFGINMGSGQRPFPQRYGWVNLDAQDREHGGVRPDVVCDAAHTNYVNDCADCVVLHHVLEHFGCGEADGLIHEARRILKPGGSLLVFVPDIAILSRRYLMHQLDAQLYYTQLYGAYMGDEHDRHKWGFDSETLRAYLKKFNWSEVKSFDWRDVQKADIAKDWYICGMECVK